MKYSSKIASLFLLTLLIGVSYSAQATEEWDVPNGAPCTGNLDTIVPGPSTGDSVKCGGVTYYAYAGYACYPASGGGTCNGDMILSPRDAQSGPQAPNFQVDANLGTFDCVGITFERLRTNQADPNYSSCE